jgi:pimeloyl-ACP methyl ester carboxylesterase
MLALALILLGQQSCANARFGPGAECRTLSVPEDRARPDGRKIPIRYVVLRATGRRQPEPVFLFEGGPGAPSTGMAGLARGPFGPVMEFRDVVLVDQRGTGASHGLMCNLEARRYPARAFGHVFDPAFFAKCRAQLEKRADLTRYVTDVAVQDIDAVREALGYEQVILWGGSFGTRIAQAYARRYPERVKAMVLDGVVPLDFTIPLTYAASLQQSLDRILAGCRARASCRDSFPDLDRQWNALVERFGRGPIRTRVTPRNQPPVEVTMSFGDFGYATRGILYRANQARELPAMISAAATTGDVSQFAQRYWGRAADFEEDFADGLHLAVVCSEDTGWIHDEAIPAAVAGSFLGTYLIDEYRGACNGWPRAAVDSTFRAPLQAPIPTLLVSGWFDPVTPPETGERVARHLPIHRHIVDSTAHHGAGFGCARPAVLHVLVRGSLDGMPAVCAGP